MKFTISSSSESGSCKADKNGVEFIAAGAAEEAFFEVNFDFEEWESDAYVMMPACVYNGNRYKRVKRKYPPMYRLDEVGENCVPLMTDVPALNPDGSGEIQVTAGDMAVPCVGIFYRQKKQALLIFTRQEIKGRNIGFTFREGKLKLSYPSNRNDLYRFCREHDTLGDKGIAVTEGEKIRSDYVIFEFACEDIPGFYRFFFEHRKCLMSDERAENGYTDKLWEIMERHFNEHNWSGEYYAEMSKVWQCGWCGGGMSTYPLLMRGSEETKERARKTIDFMTKHQAPSGFFFGMIKEGEILDDSFGAPGLKNLHLIRKSGDGLYFLLKTFDIVTPKQSWIDAARKCADAFVKLFREYGTFGQFIDVLTGRMVVAESSAGAIAIGALAKAGVYFKDEKYLEVARAACKKYYNDFTCCGITTGGPGEILTAPDSESAFAMVESCIALYEATKEQLWLDYAEDCTHQASSWVVTYKYKFPADSEFARLDINTVGSVFANVQNKHSAPGICTFSGDCIYKLYKFTGNEKYLELIKDIAFFIPQCVSTEERPIYSWDVPKQKLSEGYICERVNMSDWETERCVGGVFNFSCWCETSLILSFVELMCYDELKES